MKHLIARVGGLVFASAILAACSGSNAGITPTTPGLTNPGNSAPAVIHRVGAPDIVNITPKDVALAHSFIWTTPHFFYTHDYMLKHHMLRPNTAGTQYPFQMQCGSSACPVMNATTAYNVYVSLDGKTCTTEKCWGTPEEFLTGLTGSAFAGLITQYTKGAASKYTFGSGFSVTYSNLKYGNTFYMNDLGQVLAAAVGHAGATGLNAEYHIFLPPGVDTCFDQTSSCYSPDNLGSMAFCAYHTAVLVPNTQTPIIFSVEPYQNATYKVGTKSYYACQNASEPSGVNRLNSGTASTLAHESFESWSDPGAGTGYWNFLSGYEIGDVCAYWAMDTFKFGSSSYYLQQMYSNSAHGCASK